MGYPRGIRIARARSCCALVPRLSLHQGRSSVSHPTLSLMTATDRTQALARIQSIRIDHDIWVLVMSSGLKPCVHTTSCYGVYEAYATSGIHYA